MKLRIQRAVAKMINNVPYLVVELNRYDYARATAYNERDLSGYTVEILKQKRSTEQNRYMWELISQISERSGENQNEIYRNAIREAGAYYTFKVWKEEYNSFCKTWEQNGVGWWVEPELNVDNSITCRAYRGTSGYNSVEMCKIIDWIIYEARTWDIEVETPEQLAKRKALWNGEI